MDKIPDDTHVLVTHGPPFVFWTFLRIRRSGWEIQVNRVRELPSLKLHAFGHSMEHMVLLSKMVLHSPMSR